MERIYFIGDLSQPDAKVLVDNCSNAKRILEFGVGGSTQIFSRYSPSDCELICIDTMKKWIDTTLLNIRLLNSNGYEYSTMPKFYMHKDRQKHMKGEFDIIFNDGKSDLRRQFANESWKHLKIGGKMIFHDTKIPGHIREITDLAQSKWLEIANIEVNPNNSNMTIITKREHQPYYNWNKKEGKKRWEWNSESVPKTLWNPRKKK